MFVCACLTYAPVGGPECDPIILPVGLPQAFKLTGTADGVNFDLDNDGVKERIGWTAVDSKLAFLAIDRNGNGRIDNGAELFSAATVPGSGNGFRALASLMPLNGPSGWVDDDDPVFGLLLLWEDRNHNGISEQDELRPASDLYTRIGLGYSVHERRDGHGNTFRYRGWATFRTAPGKNEVTGKDVYLRQRDIYDVFFVRQ